MSSSDSPVPVRPRWKAPVAVGAAALVVGGIAGGMLGAGAAESSYLPQLNAATADLTAAQSAAEVSAQDAVNANRQLDQIQSLLEQAAADLDAASADLDTATAETSRWMGLYQESAALGDEMLAAYNAQWNETQGVIGQYNALIADYNSAVATAQATVDAANAYIGQQDAQILSLGNDLNSMLFIADQQAVQLGEQNLRLTSCNEQLGSLVLGLQYLLLSNQALLEADADTAGAYLDLALTAVDGVPGTC